MRAMSAASRAPHLTGRMPATGKHRPDLSALHVSDQGSARESAGIERFAAMTVLVALGLRQFVHSGVTSGFLLAIVLCPVWVIVLRRYRGGRLLNALVLLTAVWGIV